MLRDNKRIPFDVDLVAKLEPLELEAAAAKWEAMTTGSADALARQKAAEHAIVELKNDAELFARIKELKERNEVRDAVLRRELDVLYRRLLPAQGDPKLRARIVELETYLQQMFSTHRSQVGDHVLTRNEIAEILNITIGTVKSLLFRAIRKLRKELSPYMHDIGVEATHE